MKYIANPVEVEAHQIVAVGRADGVSGATLWLDDGSEFYATAKMMARMTPVVGDYVVEQIDGYVYLNPKAVFERKYQPV